MNTPTPRTDAAVKLTFGKGHNTVCPNFARELERELTALTAERDQLRDQLAAARHRETIALASWDEERNRALREGARVVEWRDRAERAEADEIIALTHWNKELKRAMKAEAELATEREKVRVLRSALENLCDEQNGAPLERHRDEWQLAMDEARDALAATEGAK